MPLAMSSLFKGYDNALGILLFMEVTYGWKIETTW